MNRRLAYIVRELALTVLLFFSFSLGAVISGLDRPAETTAGPAAAPSAPASNDAAGAALILVSLCALEALVVSWMIYRSSLWGWKLMGTVFLVVFGLGTAQPQIESVVFLGSHLPPGFVGRLFVMGAITAALFAAGAVWILGRTRQTEADRTSPGQAGMRAGEWIVKVAGLAILYVALYFLAGYFIAFQNPELRAYYHDTDPGRFLDQMQKLWATTPWLFGFQAFRGALWIALVAPVVVSFRGQRFELAFLLSCLFSVWFLMLLQPNPYMPHSVRMSHLAETVSSQFVFGWLAGALLGRNP